MKINQFDVVKLKNKDNAVILNRENQNYLAEIINLNGETKERREIQKDEISNIIYSRT